MPKKPIKPAYDDTAFDIKPQPEPVKAEIYDTTPPPPRKETKSKRVNLLVRPSVYDKLKVIAAASGVSVNDYINTVMERIVAEQNT